MSISVGIIGTGRIGNIHLRNLLYEIPGFKVQAIFDPLLGKLNESFESIPTITDDEKTFWASKLDAVLICSPSDLHVSHLNKALERELHIFCEKPVSKNLEDHEQLAAQVENKGIVLQVGFNRRFDDDFSHIATRRKNGDIGNLHFVKISSRDPRLPPKQYLVQSGGLFLDMSIHDFDMARYLSGDEVLEVYAEGACLVDPSLSQIPDIDTATISLKFKNGGLGIIDNSREATYGYDQRVEVFGSNGSLANRNHTSHSVVKSNAEGVFGEKPLDFFIERYKNSYIAELSEFGKAIAGTSSSYPTLDDAYQATRIAIAANESLVSGQPISL